MIDTDKFEGHTPGPWAYCEYAVYAEGNPIIVSLIANETELTSKLPHRWADFRLIAAAPDLLAEVKRLQKESHQRWLRIQELNEEINVWKEGDDRDVYGKKERIE